MRSAKVYQLPGDTDLVRVEVPLHRSVTPVTIHLDTKDVPNLISQLKGFLNRQYGSGVVNNCLTPEEYNQMVSKICEHIKADDPTPISVLRDTISRDIISKRMDLGICNNCGSKLNCDNVVHYPDNDQLCKACHES